MHAFNKPFYFNIATMPLTKKLLVLQKDSFVVAINGFK